MTAIINNNFHNVLKKEYIQLTPNKNHFNNNILNNKDQIVKKRKIKRKSFHIFLINKDNNQHDPPIEKIMVLTLNKIDIQLSR